MKHLCYQSMLGTVGRPVASVGAGESWLPHQTTVLSHQKYTSTAYWTSPPKFVRAEPCYTWLDGRPGLGDSKMNDFRNKFPKIHCSYSSFDLNILCPGVKNERIE